MKKTGGFTNSTHGTKGGAKAGLDTGLSSAGSIDVKACSPGGENSKTQRPNEVRPGKA